MSTTLHPHVILAINKKKVSDVQSKGHAIYNAMVAAAGTFTAPNPSMPVLYGLLQALDAAEEAAQNRGKGLVTARNLKLDAVTSALESERSYVQTVVDQTPAQGPHLAELAGMTLASVATHNKPALALGLTVQAGQVDAQANASLLKQGRGRSRKTVFNWRISADGGKTWTAAPSTPLAKTSFTGLASMTSYGVQVCITDSAGSTEWSQTIAITTR